METQILLPDDLQELKFTSVEQIQELVTKYDALDVPKEHTQLFSHQLTNLPNSWFVQAGDLGLFYFTNITPRLDAQFHITFWDKKLTADRRECAKIVLKKAAEVFDLLRVTAIVVESNLPMAKTLWKIGFTHEGTLRKAHLIDGIPINARVFGLLREEMTWPTLKTSLA